MILVLNQVVHCWTLLFGTGSQYLQFFTVGLYSLCIGTLSTKALMKTTVTGLVPETARVAC
jgi:hypothetical protein